MNSKYRQYEPLYLKYRPQLLADLIGQSSVTRTLSNAIEVGRLSHAYLFTGPRGTGKTSTARILAKSVNCEIGPTANPCQKCTPCLEVKSGSSPAVFEIDAASNNSVDDARTLIERAPLVAVGGRFKLYIIDECHMLTKEAFNALLKTIEEPPANVIFILATTEEHKVPATIVSRCQRLMFRLVSQADLVLHLSDVARKESIAIEEEALSVIARRSGGGLRDALGLLDQSSLLGQPDSPVKASDLLDLVGGIQEEMLLQISQHIWQRNGQQALRAVNDLIMIGREPAQIVSELARHFLNLAKASYLSQAKPDEKLDLPILGSASYVYQLIEQAGRFERGEISQIIDVLVDLDQALRRTTQAIATLEMGLLSICHRHNMLIVNDLLSRISQIETKIGIDSKDILSGEANSLSANMPAKSVGLPVLDRPAATNLSLAPGEQLNEMAANGEPGASQVDVSQITLAKEEEEPEVDLEQFWSDLLGELQATSIPAFSLLSEHAFPLTLTGKEFSIGVLTDNFKTMVERRIEKFKGTFEALIGHSLNVKVKVVSEGGLRAIRSNQADIGSERERRQAKTLAELNGQSHETIEMMKMDLNLDEQEAHTPSEMAGAKVVSGQAVSNHLLDSNQGFNSSSVKEAYKLFDGPGSRLII